MSIALATVAGVVLIGFVLLMSLRKTDRISHTERPHKDGSSFHEGTYTVGPEDIGGGD